MGLSLIVQKQKSQLVCSILPIRNCSKQTKYLNLFSTHRLSFFFSTMRYVILQTDWRDDRAATNDCFRYWLICRFLFFVFLELMDFNMKCQSELCGDAGNIFKCLILFDQKSTNPKIANDWFLIVKIVAVHFSINYWTHRFSTQHTSSQITQDFFFNAASAVVCLYLWCHIRFSQTHFISPVAPMKLNTLKTKYFMFLCSNCVFIGANNTIMW